MKVLVSACIMGENCKYNGKNNKNSAAIHFLKDKEVISICPEVLAGMETPRPCAEIVNGRVVDENGNDVNAEKAKTETAKNEVKVKEGVIESLNTKIKELGDIDIEQIKKEQFDLGKAEGSKEVEEFKKTNALKSSIKGAKDFDLVYSKLDKDKIKYEKNDKGEYTVSGIDEQIKDVKEKYSFLFDDEDDGSGNPVINLGGNHNHTPEKTPQTLYGALKEKFNQ